MRSLRALGVTSLTAATLFTFGGVASAQESDTATTDDVNVPETVTTSERSVTFAQLFADLDLLESILTEAGVNPEDVVADTEISVNGSGTETTDDGMLTFGQLFEDLGLPDEQVSVLESILADAGLTPEDVVDVEGVDVEALQTFLNENSVAVTDILGENNILSGLLLGDILGGDFLSGIDADADTHADVEDGTVDGGNDVDAEADADADHGMVDANADAETGDDETGGND